MNRAIRILERMNEDLLMEVADMAEDYGYKEDRTIEQQAQILALMQFSDKIDNTIKELRDYQVRESQGGTL
jgi:hypothetical protein